MVIEYQNADLWGLWGGANAPRARPLVTGLGVGVDFKIIISQKSNAAESNHSDESDIGGIYITFSEKHFSAKVY